MKLLYNSKKDGANGYQFHQKCDNKGSTYTVIKTKAGKTFGFFLANSWHSQENYVYDDKAYMFSIENKAKYELIDKATHAQYAGYGSASYGPTFGGGNDVYIPSNFENCQCNLNKYSYNFPDNVSVCGGHNFQVDTIEIFGIGSK